MKWKPRRELRRRLEAAYDQVAELRAGEPDPLEPAARELLLAAIDAAARPGRKAGRATREAIRARNAGGRAALRAIFAALRPVESASPLRPRQGLA